MNAQELLETYGKAAVVVKAHYLEKFLESMNTTDVPENFKEFAKDKGIDNDTIAKMIELAPRTLFDVFDTHSIYIQINVFTGGAFSYSIIGDLATVGSTDTFPIRIEAEKVAIEEAFKVLNEKL